MRVDLKSFLAGAILFLVLFIVIGQTTKQSYPIGRFQIVMPQIDTEFSGRPLLFDTKTGNTWLIHKYNIGDKSLLAWAMLGFGNPADTSNYKLELENYYKVLRDN